MSFIPMDSTHLTVALQNDVQQWRTTIYWAQQRQFIYNQNLTGAVMDGLGVASGDKALIQAFIADLANFNLLAQGQAHATGSIFLFNCAGVLGIT
jgi:hypothetical protein